MLLYFGLAVPELKDGVPEANPKREKRMRKKRQNKAHHVYQVNDPIELDGVTNWEIPQYPDRENQDSSPLKVLWGDLYRDG